MGSSIRASLKVINLKYMGLAGFPTYPEPYGIDAVGADTYTTIVTPTNDATHLYAAVQGSNDVILSVDGGKTDHFYIPAGSSIALDYLKIKSGVSIQAKNATPGSNYINLTVTIW